MKKLGLALIGAEIVFAASIGWAGVHGLSGTAYAMSETTTVDGVDYPMCVQEDCSDIPGQVGVWVDPDTGNRWLSLGEYSVPIDPTPQP